MKLTGSYVTSRSTAPIRVGVCVCAMAALLFVAGCARRTPITDLSSAGGVVHVQLTTADGSELSGTLISLDASRLVAAVTYRIEGDVGLRGYGDEAELFIGAEPVPGVLVEVGRDDGGRTAIVHRSFATRDVVSATFHTSEGERSLGSIVSMFLGPAVGGAAGLIF